MGRLYTVTYILRKCSSFPSLYILHTYCSGLYLVRYTQLGGTSEDFILAVFCKVKMKSSDFPASCVLCIEPYTVERGIF